VARDYEPDQAGMRALLASREMQQVCVAAGQPIAAAWAAVTPRDTGETAASTRVEADRTPDGRAGAKVVQGGASVPQIWGDEHAPRAGYVYEALRAAT
jgi:hypothetical protein